MFTFINNDEEFVCKAIDLHNADLINILTTKHYLHRIPTIKYAYGLFTDNKIIGVITFSPVHYIGAVKVVTPLATTKNSLELSRLWLDDKYTDTLKYHTNLTSRLVGYALRQLKDKNKIIISYADSAMGHTGAIYQATNFMYFGTTEATWQAYNGVGKMGGKWIKGNYYRYRIYRSAKHRYIYLAGSKSFKKAIKSSFILKQLPYPKADQQRYQIGTTEPRIIKDIETNKFIKETDFYVKESK